MREALLALLARALDELDQSRRREGAKLEAALRERVDEMQPPGPEVAPLVPAALRAFRRSSPRSSREAIGRADEERIRQELVLYAARIDVDEELTRLGAHFDEVERVLDKGGAVGKRLDFLARSSTARPTPSARRRRLERDDAHLRSS